jgi:hypothetical protein
LAALAAAACAPGAAAAQTGGGAALGGPNKPFTIGLQDITAYDSNPARGSALNAAIRGLDSDEMIYSPSVTAVYSHSVGQEGLALNANLGYDFHSKNDSLNSEHLDFSAIGNMAVGALCTVGGSATYDRAQSNLNTLTINVTRNTLQTYRISGSQSCHSSGGLTETVQLYYSDTQNSNASLVNSDVVGVSGLVGYTNSTIGTVGLTLAYDRTNYGADPLTNGTTPQQMDVTSVGVSLSRPIGARLTGSAAVSYSRSENHGGTIGVAAGGFSGLTTSVGLSYIVGPRLRLSTNVSRGVQASLLAGVSYSVATNASLAADYTVSSRITAGLGGSWSHTDYLGRDPRVILATPGWQELSSFYAHVSTTFGRRWSASLQYTLTEGRANLSLYDYTSNYVGLTLATSF